MRSPSPGKDYKYLLDQSVLSLSDSNPTQLSLRELQVENSVLKAHIQLLLKEKSLHKEYKARIEGYLHQIHQQYQNERAQFIEQVQNLQAELAHLAQKYADFKKSRRHSAAKRKPAPPQRSVLAKTVSTGGLPALSKTIVELEIEQAELRQGLHSSKGNDTPLLQRHLVRNEQKLAEARTLQESWLQSRCAFSSSLI